MDEEETVFNVCIKRFCILFYCKWKLSSSIRSFWNESTCLAKSRIVPAPSGKLILPSLSLSYSLTRRQCFPIQPTSHNPCVLRFDLKLKPITLYYERVPTFSDSGLQDTLHDQSAYPSVSKIKFSDLTYNSKDTSVRRWKWNDLWTLQVLRGRPRRGRVSSLLSLLPTAFLYNRQDRRIRNL